MSKIIYLLIEGEYSTKANEMFSKVCNDYDYDNQLLHANYFLNSHPNDGKPVTPAKFRNFIKASVNNSNIEEIKKDLANIKPDLVILMGGNIVKHFTNASVSSLKNRILDIDYFGITCKTACLYAYNYYKRDNQMKKLEDSLNYIVDYDLDANNEPTTEHEIIKTVSRFEEVIDYCIEAKTFCFDFETNAKDWFDPEGEATILSISFNHGFSYILPLYHREPIFEDHENVISSFNENALTWKPKVIDQRRPIFSKTDIDYFFQVMNDDIFSNIKVKKIAHNLDFDLHWMARYGVKDYDGKFSDTMLMYHLIDENTRNGLKELTKEYFPKFGGYEDALKMFSWESTPLDILSKYASVDTDITLRACAHFEHILMNDKLEDEEVEYNLEQYVKHGGDKSLVEREKDDYILYVLYRNLIIPSFFTLFHAEHHGAKIDPELIEEAIIEGEKRLKKKHKELAEFSEVKRFIKDERNRIHGKKILELKQKIEKRIGMGKDEDADKFIQNYKKGIQDIQSGVVVMYEDINYNSPTQLKDLLFNDGYFEFPLYVDPRSGETKRTSERSHLKEIDHPFINTLFAYRSISKMLSTYYRGIKDKLDTNNFIHTSFLLNGTKTGRLSSRNPNLQNIPTILKFKDEDAEYCLKMVKKFFTVLDDSYYLVQADYSQAELRVIANFSRDDTMIDTYKKDIDIHALTASRTIEMSLEEFYKLDKKDQKVYRWGAKGTNFGLVFDISVEGYRQYLKTQYGINISSEEAQDHSDKFFSTYSKLKQWHSNFKNFAKITGYVRTLFGRKRRLEHIKGNTSDSAARATDERLSINNPVQGTSGEYTTFSASILRHRLPKDCIFFNTVHDSIFFYIKKDKLEHCLDIIHEACENPPVEHYFGVHPGEIPMKMDIELSDKSWGEQVEYEEFLENNSNN